MAWPIVALAQKSAMPVIGFLHSGSASGFSQQVTAFRQSLKDGGYVEGQNVAIEYRWAEGQAERLPMLAADLVRRPRSFCPRRRGDRVTVLGAAARNVGYWQRQSGHFKPNASASALTQGGQRQSPNEFIVNIRQEKPRRSGAKLRKKAIATRHQ
jgi:hypothetical protein